ncbi:unnamed protein product, partial [Angiostrongylus costaricensis]|uniref:Uncharacterized protein n=1 Tax=Angiostrongylus costaricensis TaxID=334426 RepID=A0A0R3PXA2_ANGCS
LSHCHNLPVPKSRERRGQPIIDYTDEFSADPFEVLITVYYAEARTTRTSYPIIGVSKCFPIT